MSRIGKLPIPVPSGVQIDQNGSTLTVKGSKGELRHEIPQQVTLTREDGLIHVGRVSEERTARALHGLTRTLVANMVTGVTDGFTKVLEIQGTGYRAQAKGKNLEFALGHSHPILVEAPEGITFTTDGPNKVTVAGIDKQQVGEVAANIRKLRKPDPYKAKGVRYAGEVIRRKVGKAGK